MACQGIVPSLIETCRSLSSDGLQRIGVVAYGTTREGKPLSLSSTEPNIPSSGRAEVGHGGPHGIGY